MSEVLPDGWCTINLLAIADVKTGKHDANHAKVKGKYRFYTCAYEHLLCDTSAFSGECLILPGNGANVGEVFFYDGEFDAYQRTYVIENIKIVPKLLYFIFYYNWKEKTTAKQYGSATNYIRMGNFEDYNFLIPPLNEQKRIVAKLDKIIPRIDKVKERLDKIPVIIKRFRQSVLTAAVTGKLTEEWREENPDVESAEVLLERIRRDREEKYKKSCEVAKENDERKPKKLHNYNNKPTDVPFDTPSIWKNTYFGNIIYDFCYGTSKKSDYNKKGSPVIRIPNILAKFLDINDIKYLDENEINENNLIDENDLLLIRSNGSRDLVGKNCIVSKLAKNYAFASYLIRIRPALLEASFVYILLNSPVIKEQFFSHAKSSAGINNINTKELSSVLFALPPLEEQKEIVRQVDNLFALADKLEIHYQKAKAKVDKLSQSVLAKAFRGELVPQDPNDEPAEKLLERIMKEKAKMEAELKKTNKKKSRKKAKSKQ
jgi:type I restriction enzyme S subunit